MKIPRIVTIASALALVTLVSGAFASPPVALAVGPQIEICEQITEPISIEVAPAPGTDFFHETRPTPWVNGTVRLAGNCAGDAPVYVDDVLTVKVTNSTDHEFSHDYSDGCSGTITEAGPHDITSLFESGANTVDIRMTEACGGGAGTRGLYIVLDPVCTIVGTTGDDMITGGPTNDVICGRGGKDSLSGGGGNDFVIGGPDRDFLAGGAEDDVLVGGNDTNVIHGGTGDDLIVGGEQLAANDHDLIFGQQGNDIIDGHGGNDVINGDDPNFPGQPGGNDVILGGGGDDTIDGGTGHDRISGEGGMDTIYGGEGGDDIDGGVLADTILGGDGVMSSRVARAATSCTVGTPTTAGPATTVSPGVLETTTSSVVQALTRSRAVRTRTS